MKNEQIVEAIEDVYHCYNALKNGQGLEKALFDIFDGHSNYNSVRQVVNNNVIRLIYNDLNRVKFLFRRFDNKIDAVDRNGIVEYFSKLQDETEVDELDWIKVLAAYSRENSDFKIQKDLHLNFNILLFNRVYDFSKPDINKMLLSITQKHYLKTLSEFYYKFLVARNIDDEQLPPQQSEKQERKLTMSQIALKFVYSGTQISRKNGNEIAKKYGHNSGEKLFQKFTYYSSSANRKGKPNSCTPKKLKNKINLIESVAELLPKDKQERAKDEVLILKKIYEAEYQ